MKRFTATEQWDKEWHRKLDCRLKCFWAYLCAKCNAIGVWEPDFELASFQIGGPVSAQDLAHFQGRVQRLADGKWWLIGFIEFQYDQLSETCPAHKPILRLLAAQPEVRILLAASLPHTLFNRVFTTSLNTHPSNTLCNRVQEEEKEKEEENNKKKNKGGPGGERESATARLWALRQRLDALEKLLQPHEHAQARELPEKNRDQILAWRRQRRELLAQIAQPQNPCPA